MIHRLARRVRVRPRTLLQVTPILVAGLHLMPQLRAKAFNISQAHSALLSRFTKCKRPQPSHFNPHSAAGSLGLRLFNCEHELGRIVCRNVPVKGKGSWRLWQVQRATACTWWSSPSCRGPISGQGSSQGFHPSGQFDSMRVLHGHSVDHLAVDEGLGSLADALQRDASVTPELRPHTLLLTMQGGGCG